MPTLTPYQIVVPILALLALSYAWSLALRGKKSNWEAILWTLVWGGIAVIALVPSLLSYLTLATGIKNQENAVIVTAIGILFFMVFLLIVRIEDMAQRQAKIIRDIALKDAGLPESPGAAKASR